MPGMHLNHSFPPSKGVGEQIPEGMIANWGRMSIPKNRGPGGIGLNLRRSKNILDKMRKKFITITEGVELRSLSLAIINRIIARGEIPKSVGAPFSSVMNGSNGERDARMASPTESARRQFYDQKK
jgi:hypothetical protein